METTNQERKKKELALAIVEYSSSSNDYLILKQSTLDTQFIKVIKNHNSNFPYSSSSSLLSPVINIHSLFTSQYAFKTIPFYKFQFFYQTQVSFHSTNHFSFCCHFLLNPLLPLPSLAFTCAQSKNYSF